MMNKNGFGYPEFFVLISLIALPFVLLGANEILSSKEVIGSKQAPLIYADFARSDIFFALDERASTSFYFSLMSLDENSGFVKKPCGGWYTEHSDKCAVVNKLSDPKDLCLPCISDSINHFFSEEFDTLNRQIYSLHKGSGFVPLVDSVFLNNKIDYELFFDGSTVRGIPLDEITYSLDDVSYNENFVFGFFSFRPAFTIEYDHELFLFPAKVFPVLENIVKNCPFTSDPLFCSQDFIPEDDNDISWSLNVNKNILLINVFFNNFNRSVCYGIYLPKASGETGKGSSGSKAGFPQT